MGIEFSGKYALNGNGGVNFQAKHDGKPIVCMVSSEALQDIAPDSRQDGAEQQYLDNVTKLREIASRKIGDGQLDQGEVQILASDLV